jgi:hypothetical protein
LENKLKTLFIKQHLDLLGPRQSFGYTPGRELDVLKSFKGKVSLFELLVFFKADFAVTPTKVAAPWLKSLIDKPGYREHMEATTFNVIDVNTIDLSVYDLVITHDSFLKNIKELKTKFPNTVFAYILAEHSSWQIHELGVDYDLFLDHTLNSVDNVVRLPQAVNFLFPRAPEFIRKSFDVNKTSIFFDYRSVGHFVDNGNNNVSLTEDQVDSFLSNLVLPLPIEKLSKTSLYPFMLNTLNENDSEQYYEKLSRSKYFVTIANRVGQAAFDAASAGALVIGTDKSLLHSKLCHPEALMKGSFTLKDVKATINKFETDKTLFKSAFVHQESFLYSYCIEHVNNIFKKACKIKKS